MCMKALLVRKAACLFCLSSFLTAAIHTGIATYRGVKVNSESLRNQLSITQLVPAKAKIRAEVFSTLF